MKFFYALALFIVSVFSFFWIFLFIIPSPKLYFSEDLSIKVGVGSENNLVVREAIKIAKLDNKGQYYYFEENLEQKRNGHILLYSILSIITAVIVTVIFHKYTHVVFPVVSALCVSVMINICLWIFTNSINKDIYIDLQNIRELNYSLKAVQFIGMLLSLEIFLLLFGFWYRFPKSINPK